MNSLCTIVEGADPRVGASGRRQRKSKAAERYGQLPDDALIEK